MPKITEIISEDLDIPEENIINAIRVAHSRFRIIKIPKKQGGNRIAIQCAAELKPIQSWVNLNILSKLPISDIATAFQAGTSINLNTQLHTNSLYSIRVDIENFFPSIKFKDLLEALKNNKRTLDSWILESPTKDLIKKSCFDKNERLPVGYQTSPLISNIVMHPIDLEIKQRIDNDPDRFGDTTLTRYADDFIFSTDKKGACNEFLNEINNLLKETKHPSLKIKREKTRFMSRNGGSTLITGLRITNQGKVTVHSNYRSHVRLLLKLYKEDRLSPIDIPKLKGHLAFIRHADPSLFTKLSFKYYKEISTLKQTN
ncbi:MAG: retron St85 family RNA-directed DNA polymerase [Acidihalobacter sp.]|uniref:retron St85 family RNA-directed DNA polymerase n=1 Tax=Acidihalobacter sp. TaxID=1872108 RepID=UPI00307D3C17